jgi:hypothetical protein
VKLLIRLFVRGISSSFRRCSRCSAARGGVVDSSQVARIIFSKQSTDMAHGVAVGWASNDSLDVTRGAVTGLTLFPGKTLAESLLPLAMDRKGILGIALAVIGLVLWQIYYTRETQKAARAQEEANRQAAAAAAAMPQTSPTPAPVAPAEAAADSVAAPALEKTASPQPAVAGKTEKVATSSVEYFFTNVGGGIASARLLHHVAEKEAQVVLNEFGSIPIGAVAETAGEGINDSFEMTVAGDEITFYADRPAATADRQEIHSAAV